MPYNRSSGYTVLSAVGDADLSGVRVQFTVATLSGIGDAELFGLRITFGDAELAALGTTELTGIRITFGEATLSGLGEATLAGIRVEVREIEFTGSFAVGDTIVIDMEEMTITLNGSNAMHLMEGDFFGLIPGDNTLTYTDNEGSRTVRLMVTRKGRWM
jgi:hypothetical protein